MIEPANPGNTYFAPGADNPPFAVGSEITLSASGDQGHGPFDLFGRGSEPLTETQQAEDQHDTDGEHASYTSGTVDFVLEAHGFSLSTAFYVGAQQDGQCWPAQHLTAIGHHTQLGYVIAHRVEPVVRYAMVMPTRAGEARHDVSGGLNLYLHGHGLKLQTFVSARFEGGLHAPDVRLQSQLSLAL